MSMTQPTTHLEQLKVAVGLLQQAYDRAHKQIADDIADVRQQVELGIAQWPGDVQPEPLDIRSKDGGYVLLDALTALVNAQTAIFQAETATRP